MEAYTGFAQLYDLFMDNAPYDVWADTVIRALRQYGVGDGLVCELGCGTGELTRRLADAGYDMIGIDRSTDMLDIALQAENEAESAATEKAAAENNAAPASGIPGRLPVLYLQQDIRSFELYGTVRACVAVCDTMNYLTEAEDLAEAFRLVNNYLDPGGIFIFMLNLPAYYESIGDATIAENRDEASFIWENEYVPETGINTYGMTFFAREDDGRFRRFEEEHVQKAYPLQQVKDLLAQGGLVFETAFDTADGKAPRKDSQVLWVIARECGKEEENV